MPEKNKRDAARGTIKVVKESAAVGGRMKGAYIKTKDTASEDTVDRFTDGVDSLTGISIYQFDQWGRRGVRETGENIIKTKDYMTHRDVAFGRAAQGTKKQPVMRSVSRSRKNAAGRIKNSVRIADRSNGIVRQTVQKSSQSGAKTVRDTEKTIKVTEKTAKSAVKTTVKATKMTQKSVAAVKAAKAAVQASRAATKTAAVTAKRAAEVAITAVKLAIVGTRALLTALVGGAWIAGVIVMMICLIGLFVSSGFGIFFSGEDTGNGQSMQTVVREMNKEYEERIESIKAETVYDVLKMTGSRIEWPEILSVYAIKLTTDPENVQEVVSMDESKKIILKEIFWQMNEISYRTEAVTETVIEETDDGNGNIVETETNATRTYLYITVTHKSAEEMADKYGFSEEQQMQLYELLSDEKESLWAAALYGIHSGDDQIVAVALSQVGNVGGEPYWSWYGFDSKVEWCACFVSWCANECGYIEKGIIPKFAKCTVGVDWFRNNNQWADGSVTPTPGMIIFFDWDKEGTGGQDGLADHVGIVERVEGGRVYTVEGNSGDKCKGKEYLVGDYEILGYGILK